MELEKLAYKDCVNLDVKQLRDLRTQLHFKLENLKFDLVAEQKNGLTVKRSLKKAVARVETKQHSIVNASAKTIAVKVPVVKTKLKSTVKTQVKPVKQSGIKW